MGTEEKVEFNNFPIQAFLDEQIDPIFILDRNGRYIYCNPAYEKLASLPETEIIGYNMGERYPKIKETLLYQMAQEALLRNEPRRFQWLGLTGYYYDTYIFPIAEGIVITLKDITLNQETNWKHPMLQATEILESITDGFFALDDEWRLIYINQAAEKFFPKRREKLIGQVIWDVLPDEAETKTSIEFHKAATDKVPSHFETFFPTHRRWFQMSAYPFTQGLSVFFRDITKLKETELFHLRLVTIVENSEDGIICTDANGIVESWNSGAEKIYGYSATEIIGKSIALLIPPESTQIAHQRFNKTNSLDFSNPYKLIRRRKDGKNVLVSIRISCIRNQSGKIIGYSEIHRDITDQKRAEIELETERERLAVTLRSIADGVIAISTDGKIVLINEAAEKLTGYSQHEAIGQPLRKVFYVIDNNTSEAYEPLILDILGHGETLEFQNAILVDRDLREIFISLKASPIKSASNQHIGVVIAFQNITEKRKVQEELQKTEKLESLGILAGGIAHDFNNILAAILANLQLASLKLDKGENIQEYLNDTINTAYKASDLTKQLLTFSRGGAPIKKSTSIIDLIQETAEFALRGSKVKLKTIIPGNLWPVEIDTGQISQVIYNIIINAKQAMPKGGVILLKAKNIRIGTEDKYRPGDYIKIIIKDQGTGIPPEILGKIFDPFFTTKKEGTGLGLAISYSIIRQHNGYLEVTSQVNRGTTFFIYLPTTRPNVHCLDVSQETAASLGNVRILLMDDEEIILKVIGEMLILAGYQVTLARDGVEAIQHYQKALDSGEPFDAVVMDLTVPGGMGGQEALAILRDIDPDVKAIISSGYANDPVIADYEQFGFCGFVVKPYKFHELNQILQRVCFR